MIDDSTFSFEDNPDVVSRTERCVGILLFALTWEGRNLDWRSCCSLSFSSFSKSPPVISATTQYQSH